MLSLTDLKPGAAFELEGQPYLILYSEHSKLGRGGAIMRTKIRNLLSGAIIERTFKGSDNFPEADLDYKKAQYLYKDGNDYFFMDLETFEQFFLPADQIGENKNYLKEEAEAEIIFYRNKPINLKLPLKMDFKVTYAEPGFKGDTASTTTKPATLETGAQIQVPLFIKIGDIIRVDTRTGEYVERAQVSESLQIQHSYELIRMIKKIRIDSDNNNNNLDLIRM